jgi:F-type H+-transporting ATPase subunit epsilon
MKLKIITATNTVLELDNILQVNIPGVDGVLGILPGHIDIITPLKEGTLMYRLDNNKKVVVIKGGIAKLKNDYLLILADDAEVPENLIREQIEESIKNAENKIASGDLEFTKLIQLEKQLRYERIKQMSLENT